MQPPFRSFFQARRVSRPIGCVPVGAALADGKHAVVVKDLRVTLGSRKAAKQVLQGVNLQVETGSLHMLLGPNGSGKSTLLRVLAGIIKPAGGSVHCDQPSGFVFQNPDHQVVLPTVQADVAFGLGRYTWPESKVQEAVDSALKLVNLLDKKQHVTNLLSGGQKQRVAIAGALAEGPRVLLLDELTTFLDVEDQLGVLQAVRSICLERKVTAIWVTHRFEELQYADSGSYLDAGRLVVSGSPETLREYMRGVGAQV